MKAVILAGGIGTRLWPYSRDLKPKQFHSFVGDRTMLQQTHERLSFLKPEDIFVATNSQYEEIVRKQLPTLPENHLIIEPAMRDTGPCICAAAHKLKSMGFGNEVMAIIYADHLIQKKDEFSRALTFAAQHIEKQNTLAVIGVRAKYPNPNLGYIKIGPALAGQESADGMEVYALDRFVEKPSTEDAKKFLNSYRYMWNTGLYLWKVDTILEQFSKQAPAVYDAVVTKNSYETAPKISIDYAVIEKINPSLMHVIPAELGWNDVGNWAALHEELSLHERENVQVGEHLSIETEGSLIFGNPGKLVVTYGVKDMIIVDTDEALLVMPKEKASEMKKLVEELKKIKKEELL